LHFEILNPPHPSVPKREFPVPYKENKYLLQKLSSNSENLQPINTTTALQIEALPNLTYRFFSFSLTFYLFICILYFYSCVLLLPSVPGIT
jgi:hypothetical protein